MQHIIGYSTTRCSMMRYAMLQYGMVSYNYRHVIQYYNATCDPHRCRRSEVFETAARGVVRSALTGVNATVLACAPYVGAKGCAPELRKVTVLWKKPLKK